MKNKEITAWAIFYDDELAIRSGNGYSFFGTKKDADEYCAYGKYGDKVKKVKIKKK